MNTFNTTALTTEEKIALLRKGIRKTSVSDVSEDVICVALSIQLGDEQMPIHYYPSEYHDGMEVAAAEENTLFYDTVAEHFGLDTDDDEDRQEIYEMAAGLCQEAEVAFDAAIEAYRVAANKTFT